MSNTFNGQFFKNLAVLAAASSFVFTAANAEYCDQGTCSTNKPAQIIEYLKTLPNDQLESFRDEEGNTAIHLSLKYNENNLSKEILAKHPNLIDIENSKQESPVYVADKHGNIDGVKLCLEYHPKKGSANNNCRRLFDKVKGTEPYDLGKNIAQFYQPEGRENKDKLAIILNLPDVYARSNSFFEVTSYYFEHFKASKIPAIMIGNGKHSLSFKVIQENIEQITLPKNVMLIIVGHGAIDQDGDHVISFDNTAYKTKTKDLFGVLKTIFKDKSIEVLLLACHGGGAIKNVDLLPKGSALLALSQPDKTVNTRESNSMVIKIEKDGRSVTTANKIEDYQEYPEKFSLQYFLNSYLFYIKTRNNIPELAVSGATKEFDYTQLTQYIGHKLDDSQKSSIVKKLKRYCEPSSNDCESNILSAIDKIEAANNIDDLKAPETLFNDYNKKFVFPLLLQSDTTKSPCSDIDITDLNILKKAFEDYLVSSPETDFSICSNKYIQSEIAEQCKLNPPSQPSFGIALAILYEIKKMATK